jgi:hypothetical protein
VFSLGTRSILLSQPTKDVLHIRTLIITFRFNPVKMFSLLLSAKNSSHKLAFSFNPAGDKCFYPDVSISNMRQL